MTSKDERMKDYEFYNDFVPALGGAPDPDGANVLVGIAYETARMFNGFLARIERDDLDASPVTDQLLREAYALLTLIPPDREWTKKVLFQMRALRILVVLWVIESETLSGASKAFQALVILQTHL